MRLKINLKSTYGCQECYLKPDLNGVNICNKIVVQDTQWSEIKSSY